MVASTLAFFQGILLSADKLSTFVCRIVVDGGRK
jgi:hypothetical protein